MSNALTGTVALVTGASSGIGAATARKLAAEGAAVVLVARRGERLDQVVEQIESNGGVARAVVADITSRAGADSAVEQAVAAFGRLDVLVNNAGAMLVGPFADAPEGEWERMVDVNIRGLLYMSRAALPHLVKAASDAPRRTADLVNISSSAGRVARPGTAVYNLTKFGVNGFTEALRQEMQAQRVRVSVVEPGNVDTELASHTREELRAGVEAQTGAIERLKPEDIADAVAYIVTSDRRVAVNEVFVRAADQSW
ncbi:NADP-dependent 3-hydroxy acid dehydrogenase YdfG [Leifsonia sp. 98AMF]|uniref:SDR family NAD(P)-dependent oxidoreductase n=1 Tax=unclassified Leifsonia TaxID=2663824 RepID=UPI00087C3C67|nr:MULTISPECIES: SDR family NAD(P)-dependent oxidoreductase [unclassified Leifsonia]SDH07685.1 NADP-dependent 3-hydroxy acid dehydrogenase YdfG [Leifsonia sp. 197AMF]SDJ32354.1 NADP-dependent 3-hydroxy acid dehydrogenase YdfG [Leifsonia sp. 466MF]SDK47543.1 NADP-dependent 3-hydroxy acid dehydrogenase YdfG [Leifsonia sp. 157MF]SDN53533.1 NADP-dependent 3-hydroxy acid dehydrogenase YdfG [Leifsonia sp. 509MF]SEN56599.1 NADP-dependent 3-hydroxy acid dehydrogenase YdfG [Leifsonia sp. 467MF]